MLAPEAQGVKPVRFENLESVAGRGEKITEKTQARIKAKSNKTGRKSTQMCPNREEGPRDAQREKRNVSNLRSSMATWFSSGYKDSLGDNQQQILRNTRRYFFASLRWVLVRKKTPGPPDFGETGARLSYAFDA
jgi:hypothetical protein